jgi:hypothetical protein
VPVILKVTQSNTTSDSNGLANVSPTGGGFSAPVEVDVQATAGTSAVLDDPLLIFPAVSTGNDRAPVETSDHAASDSGAIVSGRDRRCAALSLELVLSIGLLDLGSSLRAEECA